MLNFHDYFEGIPSISGPHGSSQFQAPVQDLLQAAFPQQMVGGPPSSYSHMSGIGANIQQLDQHMRQDSEK